MSPLGQAIAAIISLLIAALAEHAAEHPMLAPGIRASIRRLEKLSGKLQAMVAEWEATQSQTQDPNRRAGFSPPHRTPNRRDSETVRRRAAPSCALGAVALKHAPSHPPSVAMWNRLPAARAPPAQR